MNRNFAFISLSAGVTETHIFGRMLPQSDGSWAYVESPFIRIYRNGGVFLFDEMDAADGNVMVSINAALANGILCNPVTGEVIERHPDTLIITAANTYGRGGDMVYVGRNALDGATLDRFCLSKMLVSYDTDLESDLAHAALDAANADALVAWVNSLRERIADTIGVNLTVNAGQRAEHLLWRGAAAAALADILTQRGVNVEIVAFWTIGRISNRSDMVVSRYVVKRADMPLDLGAVAVALAEIAYARLICLYGLGRHMQGILSKHMGHCETLPAQDRAGIDYLAESNVTSRERAEEWLRESAAHQESEALHV